MQKKRVLILGAGISGLAAAWHLNQTKQPLEITLLEKKTRPGGWLHTDRSRGFHFETGPRAFRVDRSPALVRLISQLKMQTEIIWSLTKHQHRYLWLDNQLVKVPNHPLQALFSPLTKGVFSTLISEWKKPSKEGDESVWEFISRRFNPEIARRIFDPLVVGIFGGDAKEISIKACFPILKAWEEKFGSITKGLFKSRQKRATSFQYSSQIPHLPLSALFSFRFGMQGFVETLTHKITGTIEYNQEIQSIHFHQEGVDVITDQGRFSADTLFCALPIQEVAHLFQLHAPEFSQELTEVNLQSIAVVNLGYEENVLPCQGFGYLIPSSAQEEVLGVVFDSSIFPEHNKHSMQTRLTVKLKDTGNSQEELIQAALEGMKRHLKISRLPSQVLLTRSTDAIPQYRVGHLEKMEQLNHAFRNQFPNVYLLGNYLNGPSVDACVQRSEEVVTEWLQANF